MAARAFLFIAGKMTQGRPARPFLARRAAAVPRARVRPRQHDPRRAGAARGDRRARLSRTRAGLAGRARPPLRQSRRPAAISSPPTTPKAWWCARTPTSDDATPNPNARRRAEPRAARGSHRPARLARAGRPAVRRRAAARGRQPVHASSRCSTRSTCGCAAPRSWSPGRATAADALVATALKLPFLDRIVLRAPSADALPPIASGARQARRGQRSRRRSSAPARPARCR